METQSNLTGRPRCTGTKKDGSPCRAFALRDDPEQRCAAHSDLPREPAPEEPAGLSGKQHAAILALLSEPGIDAAAAKCGCNPATLWKWRKRPDFREALAEARREVFSAATTRLAAAAADAVQTLVGNLSCGMPPVEVGAAKAILEYAGKALELEDLAARMEAIEARMAEEKE